MLGCSTTCPNCRHEFTCCPIGTAAAPPTCCTVQRFLTGGGLVPSPQVSPGAHMATPFLLPPFQVVPKPAARRRATPDIVAELKTSGFYYDSISFEQAEELLRNTAVGTFLVRNSSDPRFMFSLSVQTKRGPTSVRLCYIDGYFRFDALPHLQAAMPVFPSVIDLVQYYVEQSRMNSGGGEVWVDPEGKWYSSIGLSAPLRKKDGVASLKHLSRLAIHKAISRSIKPKLAALPAPHTHLDLPKSLVDYLNEYPHSL